MKLCAWHKAQGDEIYLNTPLMENLCDIKYASYVFTHSIKDHHPDTIVGGTGIDIHATLPDEIEHIMPDYETYKCDYAMGFASRGCPNKCKFCFVPKKEGPIRANAHPDEFVLPKHKHVMFLDNNIIASPNCNEVMEWCINFKGSVDFNQGLDCRLIDGPMANVLGKIKIRPYIRLAVDTDASKKPFEKAYKYLKNAGVRFHPGCVMVLIGQTGTLTQQDFDRIMWVDSFGDTDPYAMVFMPPTARPGWRPAPMLRYFSQWVNQKAIFRSCTWEEFKKTKKIIEILPRIQR